MLKLTSATIAERLRSDIVDGILGPGLQIRQEAIAERFGVSRVPVREALRQLEAEGLILSVLHKGAFVISISLAELVEMLDIRIALETRALRLALPNISTDTLENARGILERYDGSQTPEQWRDLNLEFHLALYEPANRPKLLKMIRTVVMGTHPHLRTKISEVVGRERPQAEHYELIKLCGADDRDRALAMLEEHIEYTKSALGRMADRLP